MYRFYVSLVLYLFRIPRLRKKRRHSFLCPTMPTSKKAGNDPDNASVQVLFDLIEKAQWPAIVMHLKSHLSDASVFSKTSGYLPLHEACLRQAPPGVVKGLLTAYPAAAKTKGGKCGYLPIHCVFRTGGVSSVVVSALILAHPNSTRTVDDSGKTPLHIACQYGASVDALNAILAAHPEGAYVRDYNGNFPIDYAKSSNLKSKTVLLSALDRASVYCTISKNTSIRLSEEFETKTSEIKEKHAAQIAKLKVSANEDRSRDRTVEKELRSLLKKEKDETNELLKRIKTLEKELNQEKVKTRKAEEFIKVGKGTIHKLSIELDEEKKRANEEEEKLRSDLANAQMKDMDQVDELEALQSELATHKHAEKTLHKRASELEKSLDETRRSLEEMDVAKQTADKFVASLKNDLSEEKSCNETNTQQIHNLNNSLASLKLMMQTQLSEQDVVRKELQRRSTELRSVLEGYNSLTETASMHGQKLMIATAEVTAIGNLAKIKN